MNNTTTALHVRLHILQPHLKHNSHCTHGTLHILTHDYHYQQPPKYPTTQYRLHDGPCSGKHELTD